MRVLCLCPTYGRARHLIENTLACFVAQTHVEKFLLIFDDYGNLEPRSEDDWAVVVGGSRIGHLPAKYHMMVAIAEQCGIKWDAVAVWDDDDIYMPWHLTAAVRAMRHNKWAYPTYVRSTYGQPVGSGHTMLEPTGGRFHGSLVVRRSHFLAIGGWPQTRRADFDQQFISKLSTAVPGDPLDYADPSYIFRWEDTRSPHCSGHMRTPDNEDWYDKHTPAYTGPVTGLVPRFDNPTVANLYALAHEPYTSWPAKPHPLLARFQHLRTDPEIRGLRPNGGEGGGHAA